MGLGLLAIAGAIGLLVAGGLRENVVYFLTPTELEAKGADVYGAPLRLGGQVKAESVDWNVDSGRLRFVITDGDAEIAVQSSGAPPAMFQEGMGVVVEGSYGEDRVFHSRNVMVKHSNEYRPPEEGEHPREVYRSLIENEDG
jgi:cytochrome c-type biogenesis protein CcmE